ncbi:DUF5615 family PIN-like protein [Hwanghaeella sp.]|uniref:DUF5615 family PIN-like protein n=1 Tax=Hwanghaeella sp. TaxID=2605943 RepID=UPI003CCBCA32
MRIRADEHVSPKIVTAVREMALSPGWEFTSIHEAGGAGSSDVYWITQFAREGGRAILTADKDFASLSPQINAVFDTGLRVIQLPPKWGMAQCHLQAAHILQWWSRIEAAIESMKERECFRPDWNITEAGELKKVKIDFQRAQRARRKGK